MHCHSAGQTVALNYRKLPKLQLTYTYSVTDYNGYSVYGYMYTRCQLAVQTTAYNMSTIAQIAIVLFLFKVSL